METIQDLYDEVEACKGDDIDLQERGGRGFIKIINNTSFSSSTLNRLGKPEKQR